MAFIDCLLSAADQGVITRSDAADLNDMYQEKLAQMKLSLGDEAAAKAAREELAKELKAAAAEKRRRVLLTDAARLRLKGELQGYRDPDGRPNVARAAIGTLSHYGYRNGSSVRGRTEAITSMAHGRLADVMFEFRRKGLLGRRDRTRIEPVVRELFGESTGDATAKTLADSLATVFEELRQRFNAAGGAIARLDGWGLPQTHDRARIKAAGRDAWKAYIAPRLDPDRMLNPLTGTPVGAAGLGKALDHVYDQIVTDGWAHMTPSAQPRGRGILSNQRQDHRFLVFKNADDWLAYNRDYGGAPPVKVMFNHINGMAKDIAAMEILGPNPGGMVEWMAQVVRHEIAQAELDKPSFAKIPTAAEKGVRSVGAGADYRLRALWQYLRGRPVVSSEAVKVIGDAKNVLNSAILGMSVAIAAPTDPFIASAARRLAGLSTKLKIGETLAALRHAPKEDVIRAGVIWEEYTHVLEDEARFVGAAVGNEWSKKLVDRSLTWSMLSPLTNARKIVEARAWQAELGARASEHWGQLSEPLRATLAGFGITAGDWDIMRKGLDTNGFLTPMAIEAATGDRRVAEQLAELVSSWGERSVPSGTPNSRAPITGVLPRGTIPGEFMDAFLQLKTFGLSFTTLQLEAIARAGSLSQNGPARGMATYFAALFIPLTLGGAFGIQARNLADGKDLEDMSPTNIQFWMRAMITGGSFGLFADFFNATENRFGQNILTSLAGPLFGMANDAAHLVRGIPAEDENTARAAINFAGRYTPVLSSHWAARGAWRRIVLDQLQWALDPEAHKAFRRKEQTLLKERGTEFWWRPGHAVPDRGPQFGEVP